jgi:hypothetical protein
MPTEPKMIDTNDLLPPPIEGPSAWYGPDITNSTDWIYELGVGEVAEIEAVMKPLAEQEIEISSITQNDFSLPTLGPKLLAIRDDVTKGRGFALMRGLPVDHWSIRESATAYFGIGTHLGNVVSQNAMGHILGHVRDVGRDVVNDPTARLYQTNNRQRYHTDRTDVVGLLCLRTAKTGGSSSLVSSMTIYNEMYKRAPDLLRELFELFPIDHRGEVGPDKKGYAMSPIYSWYRGFLSAFYTRSYIDSSRRFADLPPIGGARLAALDMVDELANDPTINLHMDFKPGDMQWVYNHTSMHDRTAYEDWPEEHRKRHLLRLWLSIPGDRPLPETYRYRWGKIEAGDRGGVHVPNGKLITPLKAS